MNRQLAQRRGDAAEEEGGSRASPWSSSYLTLLAAVPALSLSWPSGGSAPSLSAAPVVWWETA